MSAMEIVCSVWPVYVVIAAVGFSLGFVLSERWRE
jgi:hypothetical protein